MTKLGALPPGVKFTLLAVGMATPHRHSHEPAIRLGAHRRLQDRHRTTRTDVTALPYGEGAGAIDTVRPAADIIRHSSTEPPTTYDDRTDSQDGRSTRR